MTIFKTTIRCGDILHVLVAATPAELDSLVAREAGRLLRANGHAVTHADGRSSWIVDEELHPTVWHADGNRVRANRVRYDRSADGALAATPITQVWISAT